MSTAQITAKYLKACLKDYNHWGWSEETCPLTIARTKELTDKKILAIDAKMRVKAANSELYKLPERTIVERTLIEVFKPLILGAARGVASLLKTFEEQEPQFMTVGAFLGVAPPVEFYSQIFEAFNLLVEKKVCYVKDNANDPYTGVFIIGKDGTGETVYAYTLAMDYANQF